MVASRQVEILFFEGNGRQRGRGFGALAQFIGRTAIPFFRKYIGSAAKRMGAISLEIAVPEYADVARARKIFKTAAKSVRSRSLRKQVGSGSSERIASRVIPTNSAKQSGRSRRDICANICH